jgi:hypothetical protein
VKKPYHPSYRSDSVKVPDDWNMNDVLRCRKVLRFTDNRERVEIVCRVELGPDGWQLVQVSENAGSPWVKRAWIVSGALAAVGFIGFGFWSLKRILWRSPQPPAPR